MYNTINYVIRHFLFVVNTISGTFIIFVVVDNRYLIT